jgi:Tol biopolymer transport system component
VYLADSGGTEHIVIRNVGEFESRTLEGTQSAFQPFISPGGDWVGFFRDGSLLRVPVAGGAPIPITPIAGMTYGGSWGHDGKILFATDSGLFLIRELGTPPTRIPIDSVRFARWPHFAPDGKHALVTTDKGVTLVDVNGNTARHLVAGSDARYAPTGHLVFLSEDRRVRAVPFDIGRAKVTGAEFPILDEVFRAPGGGAALFAVASTSGTLIYTHASFHRTLWLVDRSGRESRIPAEARGYRFPSVSPDGRYLAVTVDPRPSDLWIVDLTRGTAERQQTPGHDGWGIWSPDGRKIAMILAGSGLAWRAFPFTGAPVRINYQNPQSAYPKQWTDDNELLTYNLFDIVRISIRDGTVTPVVATAANEQEPVLSPDGRWLAYQSNMSGTNEVYVQSFPDGADRQIVSRGGGVDPRWSRDGTELYYRLGNTILAVPVRTGQRFQILGPGAELFTARYDFTQTGNWTLGPGGRFLMIKSDPGTTTRLHVVMNWFEELRHPDIARTSR